MSQLYSCVVPGCDRKFEKPHGAKVHFRRSHSDLGKWKSEWNTILNRRQQLSMLPEKQAESRKKRKGSAVSSHRFLEGMIEALRKSPTLQLTTGEMMSELRERRITNSNSDESLRTRISTEVRNNPTSDVQRASRGVYTLVESSAMASTLATAAVERSPDPVEEVFNPSQAIAEIEALRRLRNKQSEAIMGLTRIIVTLVAD